MQKKSINIIGAGAAGLFLALALRDSEMEIHLYDQQNAPARKFLVAGEGGLNLTHSEVSSDFLNRYTPSGFIRSAFLKYDNLVFRHWLEAHGINLFTGTSGRVFPIAGIKPATVLKHLLNFLKSNRIHFHFRHQWQGFDADGVLLFKHEDTHLKVPHNISVFALGGASWPVTGSKGEWLRYFSEKGVKATPFEASNCRFLAELPTNILHANAGKPLKNIELRLDGQKIRGELLFNKEGVEGSGIYPFSPLIRKALKQNGKAVLHIDLKPHNTEADLVRFIKETQQNGSWSEKVQKALRLDTAAHRLLKHSCSKDDYLNPEALSKKCKAMPLIIVGTGPLDEAISSVGGIALEEINENFELIKMADTYVMGEMLDYDAPTGGYLLQSCFSMAMQVAEHLKKI